MTTSNNCIEPFPLWKANVLCQEMNINTPYKRCESSGLIYISLNTLTYLFYPSNEPIKGNYYVR